MSTSCRPVVAVCQVTATPDKKTNFSACKQLVEEAKERGASMVFLPEAFDYIGSSREETLSLSESLTGDTMSQYTQLARYRKMVFYFVSSQQKLPFKDAHKIFLPQIFPGSWRSGCHWVVFMNEDPTGSLTDASTTVTSSSMTKVPSVFSDNWLLFCAHTLTLLFHLQVT